MLKKSSKEVEINPKRYSNDEEETFYRIEFGMNEIHSLSNEQREEILQVLLKNSIKKDSEEKVKEDKTEDINYNQASNVEESVRKLIMLLIGIIIGAFTFFLASTI